MPECAGSMESRFLYPSWQRLFGYVEAHLVAGIAIDRTLIGRVGAYSRIAARNQVMDLLSRADRPTALFTGDGLMSVGSDCGHACNLRATGRAGLEATRIELTRLN
jgi:LacI family transcriptional regulator